MKIIARSLSLINNGKIDQIEKNYFDFLHKKGESELEYLHQWIMYKSYLENQIFPMKNNVKYITDPFLEQVTKNIDKLVKLFFEEGANNNETFLDFKGILFSNYIGCTLVMKGRTTTFSLFNKDSGAPVISGNIDIDANMDAHFDGYSYLPSTDLENAELSLLQITILFIASILFQKMITKKEIIIVPPRGRKKIDKEKFVNENPTNIEVWDTRMYTSYVRLEGFTVKGHLRMQLTGKGRTDHRIIWINEFQKHGYNYKHLRELSN